ncbi:MAG: hypothetical protein WC222_02495 [Parachlamydiales bacterium]|jgi:hypothetical protein
MTLDSNYTSSLQNRETFYQAIQSNPEGTQKFCTDFLERANGTDQKLLELKPGEKFYYDKDTLEFRSEPLIRLKELNPTAYEKAIELNPEGYAKAMNRSYAKDDPEIETVYKNKIIHRHVLSEGISNSNPRLTGEITHFLFYKGRKGWDAFITFVTKLQEGRFLSIEDKIAKHGSVESLLAERYDFLTSNLNNIKLTTTRVEDAQQKIFQILTTLKNKSPITQDEKEFFLKFKLNNYSVLNMSEDVYAEFSSVFEKLQKFVKIYCIPSDQIETLSEFSAEEVINDHYTFLCEIVDKIEIQSLEGRLTKNRLLRVLLPKLKNNLALTPRDIQLLNTFKIVNYKVNAHESEIAKFNVLFGKLRDLPYSAISQEENHTVLSALVQINKVVGTASLEGRVQHNPSKLSTTDRIKNLFLKTWGISHVYFAISRIISTVASFFEKAIPNFLTFSSLN